MSSIRSCPTIAAASTLRLSVLQYVVAGGLRGAGGRLLGLPGRAAREVPRDGGEQPSCAGCRCRRRAACCSTATARCSSRTRTPSTSRSSASRRSNIDRHAAHAAAATGADEAQLRETRQPPAARAELPADRPDRERHARAGHRGPGAAAGAARHHLRRRCRRGKYPPSELAAHLFGYVGEVTETQLQRAEYEGIEAGRDRRAGRHRAGLQQAADGHRRRPSASSSTASAARSATARAKQPPVEGRRAAADDRRRRAEGDRGRLRARPASTAPRSCSIRATARCWRSPACRPTIRTRSPAASTARRGRRSTPTS